MLTEKNIHTTNYRQSDNAGTVAFSTTNYWVDENNALLSTYGTAYPVDVYEDNDMIKPIVDEYVEYLNTKLTGVTGNLLTYCQAEFLGCVGDSEYQTCGPDHGTRYGALEKPAPGWLWAESYALSSAGTVDQPWRIEDSGWFTNSGPQYFDDYYGVRPVITISTSDIQ